MTQPASTVRIDLEFILKACHGNIEQAQKHIDRAIIQAYQAGLEWAGEHSCTSHASECCHETAENNAKAYRSRAASPGGSK